MGRGVSCNYGKAPSACASPVHKVAPQRPCWVHAVLFSCFSPQLPLPECGDSAWPQGSRGLGGTVDWALCPLKSVDRSVRLLVLCHRSTLRKCLSYSPKTYDPLPTSQLNSEIWWGGIYHKLISPRGLSAGAENCLWKSLTCINRH
jgi:hypothetical protein